MEKVWPKTSQIPTYYLWVCLGHLIWVTLRSWQRAVSRCLLGVTTRMLVSGVLIKRFILHPSLPQIQGFCTFIAQEGQLGWTFGWVVQWLVSLIQATGIAALSKRAEQGWVAWPFPKQEETWCCHRDKAIPMLS